VSAISVVETGLFCGDRRTSPWPASVGVALAGRRARHRPGGWTDASWGGCRRRRRAASDLASSISVAILGTFTELVPDLVGLSDPDEIDRRVAGHST
jgi:hypothetical protein